MDWADWDDQCRPLLFACADASIGLSTAIDETFGRGGLDEADRIFMRTHAESMKDAARRGLQLQDPPTRNLAAVYRLVFSHYRDAADLILRPDFVASIEVPGDLQGIANHLRDAGADLSRAMRMRGLA